MKYQRAVKYFLLMFIINSTFALNNIENHSNIKLLPKECGKIDEYDILSDKPHFEEFPWMTVLTQENSEKETRFVCVGTLINSRYVLTVANCAISAKVVRIGEYNLNTTTDCEDAPGGGIDCALPYQDIGTEEVVIHPEFKRTQSSNDIALVRLGEPVDLQQSNIGVICLPTTDHLINKDVSNSGGTLVGWRLLSSPTTLKKSHGTVYSKENCEKINREFYSKEIQLPFTKLCIDGSPFLESGAPLMIKSDYPDYQRYVQYGILSGGKRNSPLAFYTDVSKYMKWILDTIKP